MVFAVGCRVWYYPKQNRSRITAGAKMDPHTQLYYAWNIPNTSTLQSTTQTPPVPQSPLQYATQQQQVGQADFTGQGFPGSGPPPYQPQSAQTIPTTSATPVSQQSSQNQNILSYPFARQSGVTSSSILNGTNGAPRTLLPNDYHVLTRESPKSCHLPLRVFLLPEYRLDSDLCVFFLVRCHGWPAVKYLLHAKFIVHPPATAILAPTALPIWFRICQWSRSGNN